MQVKLLVPRTGPAGAQNIGDVIDVSENEAKRMFESSPPQAVPFRGTHDVETADAAPRRGRKKG